MLAMATRLTGVCPVGLDFRFSLAQVHSIADVRGAVSVLVPRSAVAGVSQAN